jgi:predicted N-acyltransferase
MNGLTAETVDNLTAVPRDDWNACAGADNPFVQYEFLKSLEDSGSVGARTGWQPLHLVLRGADGAFQGCAPMYIKGHSQGEYVFDHAWADAYERAGGRYYPKLQIAVPFTPVTGPRLLARPGEMQRQFQQALAQAAAQAADKLKLSSLHVTFATHDEWELMGKAGYLQRMDRQYHWQNDGYGSFDDFLAALSSSKRKMIRRERRDALSAGLRVQILSGRDIQEAHWDAFFNFYMDTGSRKWGRPYLNRSFFSLIGERMADRIVLILATRDGKAIAGALNLLGHDAIYGRYWGAVEDHPFLHFELCYYQAIDYAIAHGLKRVEAGAQGEHKIARGYLPKPTYSAHWIGHDGFRQAVADYLVRERAAVGQEIDALATFAPFKLKG